MIVYVRDESFRLSPVRILDLLSPNSDSITLKSPWINVQW